MPQTDASLSVAERVDAACDRYESDHRAGKHPRIEDFVSAAPATMHEAILRGLIPVELELLAGAGEHRAEADYRQRFPKYASAIAEIFAGLSARKSATAETSISRESVKTGQFKAKATNAPRMSPESLAERIGRFQVLSVLGEGAFGRVYRAKDPQLGREVAIKVPFDKAIQTDADRDRFLREARAAAGIHHPNVCPVHEVGEADGKPYIVMAMIPGQSLGDLIKSRKELLPERQAAVIIRKLASALDAAHSKRVVHRDLKPANVMFDRERKDVVVTDFGLARGPRLGDGQATQTGIIMGTPAYMSPEQARGDSKNVGPAADIYSLGIILYELLAGCRPFSGSVTEVIGQILHVEPEPPSKHRPGIDPRLEAACLKAIAKDPAKRFASMKEFAAAMDAFLRKPSGATTETARAADTRKSDEEESVGTDTRRLADLFAFHAAEQKEETEAAVERAVRKARTPRWVFVLFGVLIVGGLAALAGIVFFTKSDKVKVTIELTDVDLSDKSLSFFLDDQPVSAEALANPVELKPGEHVLVVKRGNEIVKRLLLTVTGGRSPGIKVKDITPSPPPIIPKKTTPSSTEDGFVSLFNGKDLTGWYGLPDAWKLDGGALIGNMPADRDRHTFLCSTKMYSDFELKFQVKLHKGVGNSGLQIRSAIVDAKDYLVAGPQVVIDATKSVGGLYGEREKTGWMKQVSTEVMRRVFKPGEFNDYFVRVVGKRVKIVVNGETLVDENFSTMADYGIIAFQLHGQLKDDVTFRNVLIRDLNPIDAGFVPLFNGKDLTGWVNVNGDAGTFYAKNGELITTGTPHGFLRTEKQYENFELEIDWMHVETTKPANSGLFVWCDPRPAEGKPFPRSIEVQMLINFVAKNGWATSHGDIFGNFGARCKPDRPHPNGQERCLPIEERVTGGLHWNHYKVIARDGVIKLHVNGKEVSGVSECTPRKGYIALQSEGSECHFKNIRIKELPSSDEQGFVPLFNGKDLTGWQQTAGSKADWRVEEAILVGGRTGFDPKERAYLMTTRDDYSDYQLRIEAMLDATADSGAYLRLQPFPRKGVTGNEQGYEVQMNFEPRSNVKTGGLLIAPPPTIGPFAGHREERLLAKTNEWFTLDITVQGGRITTFVNGIAATDFTDSNRYFAQGHIGLQYTRGLVKFRKVEIKELPSNDGFVPLFNGKDLTGWKAIGEPKWSWADGRLLGSPAPGGGGGFLVTEAEYEDFELELQYRVGVAAGSGVFLRCISTGPTSGAGQLELQIIDDDAYPMLAAIRKTGSIFNVFARRVAPPVKLGVWNDVRVRLKGRHLQVWFNDVQTIDADLDTAGGKLATVPGLTCKKGGIGLQQNQKSEVEFRNVRIKNLSTSAEQGFAPLFNGKDLTGWTSIRKLTAFTVDDGGNLVIEGDTTGVLTWLVTERDYSDFVLRLDFQYGHKRLGQIDSGVAIRALPDRSGAQGAKLRVSLHNDPKFRHPLGAVVYTVNDSVAPTEAATFKPDGEWNALEIEAIGPRVRVSVNGKLVNDVDLSKIDRGTIGKKENYALADLDRKAGRIGLQSHYGTTKYRNIRLKDLTKTAADAER